MRLRLLIEYDGSDYCGWQIQNGHKTVQGAIENALQLIIGKTIRIIGAGRTDSGVHARGQVAHFDLDRPVDIIVLQRSLNGILKRDIRIRALEPVESDFHARYSAKLRQYHYLIASQPTAILRNFTWNLSYDLDINKMNRAAKLIIGQHDFKSFCRTKSDVNSYICSVKTAKWLRKNGLSQFIIQADRFLHGMVRALVGAFVDIGRSKLEISELNHMLQAGNRALASQSAPAKGLILEKIYY